MVWVSVCMFSGVEFLVLLEMVMKVFWFVLVVLWMMWVSLVWVCVLGFSRVLKFL